MNIERSYLEAAAGSGIVAAEGSTANGQLFDFAGLLRLVRMRHRLILGTAATVVILTAIVLFQIKPLYTASALVMLEGRQNNVVNVESVLSSLSTDPASIENQVQILASRGLAASVIDNLNLHYDPEFNSALRDEGPNLLHHVIPINWFGGTNVSTLSATEEADRQREKIIDSLLARLSVQTVGRSTAMLITIESESASKAAQIANATANAYVDDQLNAKFEATQRATTWLSERLASLAQQVQQAETEVALYKAENDLVVSANGNSVAEQQLTELNAQLILALSNLAEQEAKYEQVLALQKAGRSADVTSVVDSPLIQTLRTQEMDLLRNEADMSARYGPRHPAMVNLKSEKANLVAKLVEEVERVVRATANGVTVARARVRSLESSLANLQTRTEGQSHARVRLSELESRAATSHALYETFLARFNETQGQESIEIPEARIVSTASASDAPSYPKKTLTLGIAGPGGLFLGFLVALLLERLDSGFRTSIQVKRVLGLPVLATVPEISGEVKSGRQIADYAVEKPTSGFADSVRALRMGLLLSNVDQQPSVVLVTSAAPGEGKTTLSISLARVAAHAGQKVIVIDADLRRPTVAKTFGIKNMSGGIVGALTGQIPLNKALIKDPRSNAHILAAEQKAPNPSDLLSSKTMENLITSLRTHFDLIVIDSAPLLPVSDTKALLRVADTAVLAVRWEKTPRDAVLSVTRTLAEMKASVAGIVLTRADTRRFRQYSYGHQNYAAYDRYYGD